MADSLLIKTAKEWASIDPNPRTSSKILDLVKQSESSCSQSLSELTNLFKSRLSFGTAGLRSKFQPGPSGMNDLTVIQTTQGVARYVQKFLRRKKWGYVSDEPPPPPKVVVGYDHRAMPFLDMSSAKFALLCQMVFQQAGMDCILLHGYVPTPLVSFSVREVKAAVGVMLTPSHNPRGDAGYKVFWGNGCQINTPHDAGIQDCIMENLEPWIDYASGLKDARETEMTLPGDKCETERLASLYFESVGFLVTGRKCAEDRMPRFAYSSMHGVGLIWAKRSFEVFGIPEFLEVEGQVLPDWEFPTVVFPNPEEKGALDVAMTFGEQNKCDIIFANDPDADRLAVAEWDKIEKKWVVFSGNQIGVMLGHWMYENFEKRSERPIAMCCSTVSSAMLSIIAKTEGFHFRDTHTGFKNIGAMNLYLRREGYNVLFSYEEAIGFCCGEVIPDKDGISALGVFAELSLAVYQQGKTIKEHLNRLHRIYGEFACKNGYFFCTDPSVMRTIFEEIRNGGDYISHVKGYKIVSIRDLGVPGYDSTTSDKKPILPTSESSPLITLRFENACVLQLRASGTEPKFKYYMELAGRIGATKEEVENELNEMSTIILEELLRPDQNGLVRP